MNAYFIADYERFTPNKYKWLPGLIRRLRNHDLRYLYWGRRYQTSYGIRKKLIALYMRQHYQRKYGLEMTFDNIGKGLRLVHPWNITVNAWAVLGENVTLYKGCTIGQIDNGPKTGNPTIGNNVTIYANATVCGNVKIGDNSEIAAGAFVNFDVPENSIVIGNPGVIHAKHR